ncbi:glycerophosphodiester phosphodiesterase family protein [Porticoccaceae bacterium]|nr:glycerophosphodiester phosphodiesterase family protein [Porticoccaceae bacterium]MDB2344264.1 glycerophosphodiester phosphodiesterase family protein [Porticoccaceae bacterium]MDB2664201.1 glycerophosphodiester phosphodiesterase family protein [Porticoccaceae bacterium]
MTDAETGIKISQLVAHRGYRAKFPENTILSLSKAIEHGATFIELDVQFSVDQLPVIYHDTDLQRVSGVAGSILEMPRSQLVKIPAYEPNRLGNLYQDETISTLEDFVHLIKKYPQVTAFVELKDESISHCGRQLMIDQVIDILNPIAQQTVIMSFDYPLCELARQARWPQVGVVLTTWDELESDIVKKVAPDYIFVDHEIVPTQENLRANVSLRNTKLVAYEVGNTELGNRLLTLGLDMLETYEIEKLVS